MSRRFIKMRILRCAAASGLCLALALSMMACGSNNTNDTTESPENNETVEVSADALIASGDESSDATSDAADEYSVEEIVSGDDPGMDAGSVGVKKKINKALKKLLKSVNSKVQPGTAGSSITAQELAESFITWGKATKSKNSVIKDTVSNYLSSLSKSDKAAFLEKLTVVDEQYQAMGTTVKKVEVVMNKAGIR